MALRELGLPLEVIGDLLTGEPDLAGLLRDHRAHLDRQLAAIRALRRRLATMVPAGVRQGVTRTDRLHPPGQRRVVLNGGRRAVPLQGGQRLVSPQAV